MFENTLEKIEINGTEYPYKCDILVLEKIQKTYGDILEFEHAIMGVVPYYDEDGVRVEEKDSYTVPDVEKVCTALMWMMEEGIEISGEELETPDYKAIMRQDDFSINDLAMVVYGEFSKSFLSKRSRKTETKTASKKKNEKEA